VEAGRSRRDEKRCAWFLRCGVGIPISLTEFADGSHVKVKENKGQLHVHRMEFTGRSTRSACCARAARTCCRSCRDSCPNDVALLGPSARCSPVSQPAGPRDRTAAAGATGPDDLLAILPRELIAAVVSVWANSYCARSELADDSAAWTVTGHGWRRHRGRRVAPASAGGVPSFADALPATVNGVTRIDASLAPARGGGAGALAARQPARAAAAGVRLQPVGAEVCKAPGRSRRASRGVRGTSEAFVAQMLNLDASRGDCVDKGCYTGRRSLRARTIR